MMHPRPGRSVGMTMLARLTLVVLFALVAGCGSDEPPPPRPRAVPVETIKYEVIGGDAFRDDKITVAPRRPAPRSRPAPAPARPP